MGGRPRRCTLLDVSVSVLVVDDAPAFRAAARAVLRRTPGFVVVGEAGGGLDAVALARQLRPDLVLMDVRMPDVDGLEATRRITAELPGTCVLLCSTADLPHDALATGAAGALAKHELAPALLTALWKGRSSRAVTAPAAPAPG